MADESKMPGNTGENVFDSIQKRLRQGESLEAILKEVDPKDLCAFFHQQYSLLQDKYDSLAEQLQKVTEQFNRGDKDAIARIERIMNLMTSNMAFIKQIIQIEDANNDKLLAQEKLNQKQDLQYASIIERQNRFSQGLKNMDTNTRAILEEIENLKANDQKHDNFRFKVITIASIVTTVVLWLMAGDNLAKLVVIISEFSGGK